MRNRGFFLLDVLLLAGLPALALALRFESFAWPLEVRHAGLWYMTVSLPLRLAVAYTTGLYRCLWRHASVSELERILYAGGIAGVTTFVVGATGLVATGLATVRVPLSVLVLDAVLALCAFAAPRLLARFGRSKFRGSTAGNRRTLVVGAGAAGQLILRETRLNDRLHTLVIGFVDDDPYKQQQLLGGVPVVGTLRDLPSLISRIGVDELIIAMPSAHGSVIRKVVLAAASAGIPARTMPALHDLISGRSRVSALRGVEIEDLLRRDPIVTDLASVRELASGQPVLVTGAGGSIGSELCRQIAALVPSRLIALDHSENQVFEIHRELRLRFPQVAIAPVIADIRNTGRIRAVFEQYRPHAVFHAAAHKHVPLMEENVVEAITNNVLGTRNVVDASLDSDIRHFVNISTDKAVRPTSVMGASKRVAEQIVLHAAVTEHRNFVSVRFGNVLGSSGSVIPTFLKQIKDGGPVTVTHPEMRRYFMTIPEAVQLVLQAGALGRGGELFVLDMGEPIRIVDLARDLIRLSGLEEGVDIEIAYTGVRPGEKLFEELFFGGEEVHATAHPKVLRTVADAPVPGIADAVDALIRRAVTSATDDIDLREALRSLVPGFIHQDVRTDPRPRTSPVPPAVAPQRPSRPK